MATRRSSLKTKNYRTVGEVICDIANILRPPERLTVTQAAEKYVYLNTPGAYVGYFKNETTPYLREPSDTFTSLHFNGIIFVAPAQAGKTQSLILNTVAYSIKVDPMDMMIVCPTMMAARDFSMRRIDRLHRHSTA